MVSWKSITTVIYCNILAHLSKIQYKASKFKQLYFSHNKVAQCSCAQHATINPPHPQIGITDHCTGRSSLLQFFLHDFTLTQLKNFTALFKFIGQFSVQSYVAQIIYDIFQFNTDFAQTIHGHTCLVLEARKKVNWKCCWCSPSFNNIGFHQNECKTNHHHLVQSKRKISKRQSVTKRR
jgi:hypothetical protein